MLNTCRDGEKVPTGETLRPISGQPEAESRPTAAESLLKTASYKFLRLAEDLLVNCNVSRYSIPLDDRDGHPAAAVVMR